MKLTGTLRKLGVRDSIYLGNGRVMFIHRWMWPFVSFSKAKPDREYWCRYETKNYFTLEQEMDGEIMDALAVANQLGESFNESLGRVKKRKIKHLLTFTEVKHWILKDQGDNYTELQPDKYVSKEVEIETDTVFNHTHYGHYPEHYPDSIRLL